MSLSVPEGPTSPTDLAEGGACEDHEESLAIPTANLDDFSFGDSNHRRLCCAIVVGEVVSQPQMHFLVTGVILRHTRARGRTMSTVGLLRGCTPGGLLIHDVSAVQCFISYPPSSACEPHLNHSTHHATTECPTHHLHLKPEQKGTREAPLHMRSRVSRAFSKAW